MKNTRLHTFTHCNSHKHTQKKRDPIGPISLKCIGGLYSSKLKAVPHPTQTCALLAIRFQLPDDKEIHATDRIAEAPQFDYITNVYF